ncbi:MAG: FAD-binding protein [Flavobacteriales bacterium]|nr:FAD-binding protein [Flavobacteriales bacterium]
MIQTFDIQIPIEQEAELGNLIELAATELNLKSERIYSCKLVKRSIDARKKEIKVNLRFQVFIDEQEEIESPAFELQDVSKSPEVHLIGSGPAGLFAALELIQLGLKPILFERGKDVKARRRDLAKINKEHIVNPESNYCFGEGGAGTYSDGKLYTRSKKRGDVDRILKGLVQFGAVDHIRIEAHPHIGTNKLPQIIIAIREAIIASGGEVHFNSKLTDLTYKDGKIETICINDKQTIPVSQLILATGHSARDVFELLYKRKIEIQAKPFALGVRVEHPQTLIDKIQYHLADRGELLPPASYKLVKQVDDKGVYSFCMCPGGIIAPCATDKGEIVTNGWSPSKRNNPYANSGIVVPVEENDWLAFKKYGPLAALRFQQDIEQKAYQAVNKGQNESQYAPAQRLLDFVNGKESTDLPECSYFPGVIPARLDQLLPGFIAKRLQKAFVQFGKTMPGYLSNDALIVGVESRTSSPVSIPRNRETLQHSELSNFYPCGEGAGYAGGIVSAAIDGVKVANAIKEKLAN